jgi:hypothetical protein
LVVNSLLTAALRNNKLPADYLIIYITLFMETNEPVSTSTLSSPAIPTAPNLFATKVPSTAAFLIASLLFLLPFSEIKCGGATIASKSGLGFVLNKEWKTSGEGMFGNNTSKDKSLQEGDIEKGNTQIFIIIALALAVIGLLVSMADVKASGGLGLIAAVLSFAALIGFMVDLKNNFKASLKEQALNTAQLGANDLGFDKIGNTMGDIKPALTFTPWYYIATITLLAAAFFCYKRIKTEK